MLIWLNNSILISSADTSGAATDPTYPKLISGSGTHIHQFNVGDQINMNISVNNSNNTPIEQRTTQFQLFRIR